MQDDLVAIEEIRQRLPEDAEVPSCFVHECDALLSRFPKSTALWCFRSMLIQAGEDDGSYDLEDAKHSLEKALEINPDSQEANEELGWYLYAIEDNSSASEPYFRTAISAGAGTDAYAGLVKALVELGRLDEAAAVLESAPENHSERILDARSELQYALESEKK